MEADFGMLRNPESIPAFLIARELGVLRELSQTLSDSCNAITTDGLDPITKRFFESKKEINELLRKEIDSIQQFANTAAKPQPKSILNKLIYKYAKQQKQFDTSRVKIHDNLLDAIHNVMVDEIENTNSTINFATSLVVSKGTAVQPLTTHYVHPQPMILPNGGIVDKTRPLQLQVDKCTTSIKTEKNSVQEINQDEPNGDENRLIVTHDQRLMMGFCGNEELSFNTPFKNEMKPCLLEGVLEVGQLYTIDEEDNESSSESDYFEDEEKKVELTTDDPKNESEPVFMNTENSHEIEFIKNDIQFLETNEDVQSEDECCSQFEAALSQGELSIQNGFCYQWCQERSDDINSIKENLVDLNLSMEDVKRRIIDGFKCNKNVNERVKILENKIKRWKLKKKHGKKKKIKK